MDNDYLISTGFRIKELSLVVKGKTEISLTGHYTELNIFDSILQPCLTGNILIEDSSGLSDSFLLDGNDFIKIHIGKVDDDRLDIKRIFRIYKQSDRTVSNQNKETYILHFISEEFITSQFKKVGQAFLNTTYKDAVIKILRDYMKTPENKILKGEFNRSLGIADIIVPLYFNPIEAIMWMAKECAIDEMSRPCFLFYENIFGYNFASLSNLLERGSIVNINFDPKNLSNSTEIKDMLGARHFEVIQQFDILSNIKNGVYGGKFIGYDSNIGQSMELNFDYNSINHPTGLNNGPAVSNLRVFDGSILDVSTESSIVESRTTFITSLVPEIKELNPGETEKRIPHEQIAFQRKAIFANFFSQRVKLVVPGNFAISSGTNVYLNIPKFAEKVPGEDNLDRTLYGHYLIIASRHKLTPDNKHETIFEACTNSSNRSDKNNKIISTDYYPNQNFA
jgi:hypothetical protein